MEEKRMDYLKDTSYAIAKMRMKYDEMDEKTVYKKRDAERCKERRETRNGSRNHKRESILVEGVTAAEMGINGK